MSIIRIGLLVLLHGYVFSVKAGAVPVDKASGELQLLKSRLREFALGNPDPQAVRKVMMTLGPDGSWPDLNYQDKAKSGWEPGIHVRERLSPMVKAYSHPENELYKDPELKDKILSALNFWLRNDIKNPKSGWWNLIGIPKELGVILLLLEDELTDEQMNRALYIMDTELRYKKGGKQEATSYWFHGKATGQNKIWIIRIHLMKAVFRGQVEEVRQCFSSVAEELTLDRQGRYGFNEGIQADYSFHQHGPQLTAGSYGHAFAIDSAYFLALNSGMSFDFSPAEKELLTHYFLDGAQWMIYKGGFDYGAMGRSITRKDKYDRGYEFLPGVEYMLRLNTARQAEFETFAGRLRKEQAQSLSGHRHFWCSDLTVHRRENYYTSVKVNSSRTMGTECGNGEGIKSYYLPDGCTFILRKGTEYDNIFALWDWTRIPGVTCEWTGEPPSLARWGGRNEKDEPFAERGNTSFVGGVSDGMYGLTALDYRKNEVAARKAWFCFDDEFVCLGSGISGSTTHPVITSVNQCFLSDERVQVNGTVVEMGAHILGSGPQAIFHNGVGYVFPGNNEVHLKNEAQSGNWWSINDQYSKQTVSKDVFSLWINHGVSPANQSYCYIVLPDTDPIRLAAAAENPAIEILSNTPTLQAVCHRKLQVMQAVFYDAGEVSLMNGGYIRVDQPCLLMLNIYDNDIQISVSNPENKRLSLTVEMNMPLEGEGCLWSDPDKISRIKIDLPAGIHAGQSVVRKFTKRPSAQRIEGDR